MPSSGDLDTDPAVLDFEREWAQALLNRVYTQLRRRFRRPNREALYDALEERIPSTASDHSLEELAQAFGKNANALSAQLKRLRKAYRHLLIAEVRATVPDRRDMKEEIIYLVKVLESPREA